MAETDWDSYTVDELDAEIAKRNSRYGAAGGVLLDTGGLKADKVKRLEDDDATLTAPDSGVTANAVRDLPDEAKTGAVRRREAREERLAGEMARWEEQQAEAESSTPQQHGVAADIAEKQAAEREGTTEGTTERTAETEEGG
jgi:hypothetical protein